MLRRCGLPIFACALAAAAGCEQTTPAPPRTPPPERRCEGLRISTMSPSSLSASTLVEIAGAQPDRVSLAVADLDSDGTRDLIVLAYPQHLLTLVHDVNGTKEIRHVDADLPGAGLGALFVDDVDLDGDQDLGAGGRLLENTGGGTWVLTEAGSPGSILAALDFDGEPPRELVTVDSSAGTYQLHRPSFTDATFLGFFDGGAPITAADLDGDGLDDLRMAAATGADAAVVHVFRGNSNVSLEPETLEVLPEEAVGDVFKTANGVLAVLPDDDRIRVAPVRGDGTIDVSSASLLSDFRPTGRILALHDLDGDGELDVLFGRALGANVGDLVLVSGEEERGRVPLSFQIDLLDLDGDERLEILASDSFDSCAD